MDTLQLNDILEWYKIHVDYNETSILIAHMVNNKIVDESNITLDTINDLLLKKINNEYFINDNEKYELKENRVEFIKYLVELEEKKKIETKQQETVIENKEKHNIHVELKTVENKPINTTNKINKFKLNLKGRNNAKLIKLN